jgi:6-pyruvoyltetrahydropterin/6-carboxytetrahydropterin synthase
MTARADTIRLHRRVDFEASHRLCSDGASEAANRERYGREADLHGHNWSVVVSVEGRVDEATGMVVNIADVDEQLRVHIADELDHKRLDLDHPDFRCTPATAENLALWCYDRVRFPVEGVTVTRVEVREGARLTAVHTGQPINGRDIPMVDVTRSYEFCASHRLHSAALSDDENRALYGKCNNERGHGHDYRVEVTVRGPVQTATGTVVDIPWLDELARRQVVDRMDYKHLNTDVPELRDAPPTTENVARVVFDLLAPEFEGTTANLRRVRVYETPKSWFDCEAAD